MTRWRVAEALDDWRRSVRRLERVIRVRRRAERRAARMSDGARLARVEELERQAQAAEAEARERFRLARDEVAQRIRQNEEGSPG